MAAASEAQRAQMRRDVAEVEAQFLRGMAAQGLTLSLNLMLSPLASLYDLSSGNTRRLVEGMEDERKTLVAWRSRWKTWAENGQRDDGSKYEPEQWQEVGRTMSNSIRWWTGEAVSRNAFVLVKQAAADTETTLEAAKDAVVKAIDALPPLPDGEDLERLLTALKWTGAAVVTIGGLLGLAYVARSVK